MKLFLPGAGQKVSHIANFRAVPGVSRVIISDIFPWSYGCFVADAAYETPPFAAPDFLDAVDRIYERDPFDVCVPIHDASLVVFSEARKQGRTWPFVVAANGPETVDVIADKVRTYEFFQHCGLPTPRLWPLKTFLRLPDVTAPYYLKPRRIDMRGTSDAVFAPIRDTADRDYFARKLAGREEAFVVQEFAAGTEINLDFFCDSAGKVRSVVAVARLGMGATRGIARGEILIADRFYPYIERIAADLRLWGPNQVQVFAQADGSLLFMEINGRLSGSSIFVKAAGVDYFEYFLKLLRNEPVEIREQPEPLHMTMWEQPHFYKQSPLSPLR